MPWVSDMANPALGGHQAAAGNQMQVLQHAMAQLLQFQ
jgi:hypothetical protein